MMSDAERQRKLQQLQDIDAELEKMRMMDPRGPAGAFSEPIPVEDKPPVVAPRKGTMQKVTEFAAPIAASMYGAAKGARLVAPIAAGVPHPLGKAVVEGAGAVAGAAAAGAGVDLTLGGVKEVMGLPGAPDSIDEVYQEAVGGAWREGAGEALGRGVIGPIITSRIAAFRRVMTPESAELMKTMANRVRAAYEEIGGAPLVEETRRFWNPGRWIVPLETELKDSAVYERLRAAGLDPEVARKVALTGGVQPSRLDNNIISRYWQQVGNTKMVADESYERARAKLLNTASLQDLGTSFAEQLPPEKVGEVVMGAVNGRFDTLNGARTMAMQALEEKLPDGLKLDISALRRSLGAPKAAKVGGVNIAGPAGAAAKRPGASLVIGLPDNPTFDQILKQRTALSSMARDGRLPQATRDEVKKVIWELDNATRDALPIRQRSRFRKFTQADDEVNKAGFDNAFVYGLLHKEQNARYYAERIINNRDAANFAALEQMLKGAPEGGRIIGQVKGAIADRFFEGAVNKHGILDPASLTAALGTETKGYGRHFLEATLGDQYVQNLGKYIKAMQTIDDAAAAAGSTVRGAATLAGAATGVTALLRGAPGVAGSTFTATIAGALFSPAVVAKALTNPAASKLLVKTAENVAAGRNPQLTARLAGRVLEHVGLTPEALFQGTDYLPSERASKAVREQMIMGNRTYPASPREMVPGT